MKVRFIPKLRRTGRLLRLGLSLLFLSGMCLPRGVAADESTSLTPTGEPMRVVVVLEGTPLSALATAMDAGTAREAARQSHADARETALTTIEASLGSARVERTFDELLCGMTLVIDPQDLPRLRSLIGQQGIRGIYEEERFAPSLFSSVELLGASALWPSLGGRGNAGSGVRIAVVDSGIRVDHPMLSASGLSYPSGYPKGDARYTSAKVIAARTYIRSTDAPLTGEDTPLPGSAGSPHGTVLASIAAGRQVQAIYRGLTQTLSGVAPGARLMNYRIFYPSATHPEGLAYTSEIIAALEDAVSDGAGVLCLGWTSLSGQSPAMSPLTLAIEQAIDAGCVVVAAAGNGGDRVGSTSALPGGWEHVLTVGSLSKSQVLTEDLVRLVSPTPVPADMIDQPFGRAQFGADITTAIGPLRYADVSDVASGHSPYACAGLTSGSLNGVLAVVTRGECAFADKAYHAQQAGAAGVLIINDSDTVEDMACGGSYCDQGEITIPVVMVGKTFGQRLLDWLDIYPDATLTIDPSAKVVATTPYVVATESARGPAFGRWLKPDLLAPGVDILAASYDDTGLIYSRVSGTSSAAAHVAGAAALLLQSHPVWGHDEVKAALMSTAVIADLTEEADGSEPGLLARGAGSARVDAANGAGLVFGPPSLSLTDLTPGARRLVPVKLRDLRSGGGSRTYAVSFNGPGSGLTITTDGQVSLSPGATKTITLTVQSSASLQPSDIEGEVLFTNGSNVTRLPVWAQVTANLAEADVLVIDNDFSEFEAYNDYTQFVTQALAQAGISFTVWNADLRYGVAQSLPDLAVLRGYPALIWVTGDNHNPDGYYVLSTPLTVQDQNLLKGYLEQGGRLLAVGQNLAEASDVNEDGDAQWGRSDLYHAYLGANWLQGSFYDPNNQGLMPPTSGPAVVGLPGTFLAGMQLNLGPVGDGSKNQNSVDEVAAGGLRDGSDASLVTPLMWALNGQPIGSGYVALAKADEPTLDDPQPDVAYRTLYYSFGPEGINTVSGMTTRRAFLERSANWLLDEVSVALADTPYGSVNALTTLSCAATSTHGSASMNYRWRIDDGISPVTVTSSAPEITHVFRQGGAYALSVEVTDALGHKAVDSSSISVLQGGASTLEASVSSARPGEWILYTVTVKNTDAQALSGQFTLPLPNGVDYVTHQGGNYGQGKLTWSGTLAPDDSYVAQLHVSVKDAAAVGTEIVATCTFRVGSDTFSRQTNTVVTSPIYLPMVLKG